MKSNNFKELNINLFTVNKEDLLNYNPKILNITCPPVIQTLDEYNENINLIKEKIKILKKYENLTDINAMFYMFFYTNNDSNKDKFYLNVGDICITLLLEIKVKNFFLRIKEYENHLLYKDENELKTKLFKIFYKYERFIYYGTNKTYFIYDKSMKIIIYRLSSYKLKEDGKNIYNKQVNVKFFNKFVLQKFYIYSDTIYDNFNSRSKNFKKINERKYFYICDLEWNTNLFKNKNEIIFDDWFIHRMHSYIKKVKYYNLVLLKNDDDIDIKNIILKTYGYTLQILFLNE